MVYVTETRPLLTDVGIKFEGAGMPMIRWMCGVSMTDKRISQESRKLAGIDPITTLIEVVR